MACGGVRVPQAICGATNRKARLPGNIATNLIQVFATDEAMAMQLIKKLSAGDLRWWRLTMLRGGRSAPSLARNCTTERITSMQASSAGETEVRDQNIAWSPTRALRPTLRRNGCSPGDSSYKSRTVVPSTRRQVSNSPAYP